MLRGSMIGRILSDPAPSRNPCGEAYKYLYESELLSTARLAFKFREAIQAWLDADAAPLGSRKRARLLKIARILSQSVIS